MYVTEELRICFCAPGKSIHVHRWINWFVDRGHEVHLISDQPYEYKTLIFHQIREYTGNRRLDLILGAPAVRRMIRKIKPDVVHSHYLTSYGLLGALAGYHPFVATAWGSDVLVSPKKSFFLKHAAKYAIKAADYITCDADHIIAPLTELGADRKKIEVIYFGVDTKKFAPEKKGERIKKELGFGGHPTVISLRHLEPIYDVESFVRAIPLVLAAAPEARFVVASKGTQEKDLKKLVEDYKATDKAAFVGPISGDAMPEYLASMDVYVSTSLSDAGLSASTAEAMASGLPVVITDFGDNKKWVEDGVSGFTVPMKDPKTLAEKIIYLLKTKDIREKFGQRSRAIIDEKNNYYREMQKVEDVYRRLIEERKR
jgi:glycosyltransferase involved in cell wall biosynthesis